MNIISFLHAFGLVCNYNIVFVPIFCHSGITMSQWRLFCTSINILDLFINISLRLYDIMQRLCGNLYRITRYVYIYNAISIRTRNLFRSAQFIQKRAQHIYKCAVVVDAYLSIKNIQAALLCREFVSLPSVRLIRVRVCEHHMNWGDSFVHCVSGTNSRSWPTNRQQERRITEAHFGFSHGSPKNCAALFSTGNCNGRALTFSERDIWLPQHRSIKPCALLPRCAMITNLHALRRALQGRSNSDLRMRYSKDSNAIVHGGLGTHFILNKECISRQHSALLF